MQAASDGDVILAINRNAVRAAAQAHGPFYIRLSRAATPVLPMMITPVGIAYTFRMLSDTTKGPFAPLWQWVGLGDFAVALAAVVAILDVIPMIGATLGALIVTAVGAIEEPTALATWLVMRS